MKTLVNTSILRHMTKNLPFVDQYALEHVYNQGKSEITWVVAWLISAATLSLTVIPLGQDHVPAMIMGILFGIPILWASVMITHQTDRRTTLFRDLRGKIQRSEKALNLGDTSTQRDDEIVGQIRRALVELTKPVVIIDARLTELNGFLKDKKVESYVEQLDCRLTLEKSSKAAADLKGQLGTFLDRAKDCLGDRIDNGHGLAQFFRQAEAELKS